MKELEEKTETRTRTLRRAGYKVVEMWSHAWDVEREQHLPFPRAINRYSPLLPRQALCGGRTNAIALYAYTEEVEVESEVDEILQDAVVSDYRIRYIDVVSLYPAMMKKRKYPIDHPIVYGYLDLPSHEECEDLLKNKWFGIVKADVNPPRGLFFPVLPCIVNSKLMFGLCRTCMMEENVEECLHSEEERRLLGGVWTTEELKKALEMGYEIDSYHEVWHYEETSEDLFTEYINENLKLKLQASGWPASAKTDAEKEAFVKKVEEKEGIKLEREKMEKNSGLRAVAKLNLNSLWGKFAQQEHKTKTDYVNSPEKYYDIILSDVKEVHRIVLLNDGEMAQVNYLENKESVQPLHYGNVILASFVTSYARLHLYEMLNKLRERVLYHDTDSIIYRTTKKEEEEIPVGSNLGEWEDECKMPEEDWLIEFASIGPKSYAYRTHKNKVVVKCKGITLNRLTNQKVHMQSMKSMIVDDEEKTEVTYPRKIIRNSILKQLHTVPVHKTVQFMYTKRRRVDLTNTLPFGY